MGAATTRGVRGNTTLSTAPGDDPPGLHRAGAAGDENNVTVEPTDALAGSATVGSLIVLTVSCGACSR